MDDSYEIVHVINARHLIDSESYQRAFESEQIGRLSSGFYIVRWEAKATSRRYDAQADYVGPFPNRRIAEDVHLQAVARDRISARLDARLGAPSSN